jgi:hypothetical protein
MINQFIIVPTAYNIWYCEEHDDGEITPINSSPNCTTFCTPKKCGELIVLANGELIVSVPKQSYFDRCGGGWEMKYFKHSIVCCECICKEIVENFFESDREIEDLTPIPQTIYQGSNKVGYFSNNRFWLLRKDHIKILLEYHKTSNILDIKKEYNLDGWVIVI